MDPMRKHAVLQMTVAKLCAERGIEVPVCEDGEELWAAFRVLVNTRVPQGQKHGWFDLQDELLRGLIDEQGVKDLWSARKSTLDPRLHLWQGDITTLAVDAVVNAANSQLLGCWQPGHHCIDNNIHTFAGLQLREECAHIMDEQGHEEPVGAAKITGAYNLPAKFVLHTVAPVVEGELTDDERDQLSSCYRSCLDLARKHGLKSVAFCCLGTGALGFSATEAAAIAVKTVRAWLDEQEAGMNVVFVTSADEDFFAYYDVLFEASGVFEKGQSH